jgi:hypothetical protein
MENKVHISIDTFAHRGGQELTVYPPEAKPHILELLRKKELVTVEPVMGDIAVHEATVADIETAVQGVAIIASSYHAVEKSPEISL